MANYENTFSTNEFTVTDEARYKELFSFLQGDITDYTRTDEAGVTIHGFGGYGGVYSDTGIEEIDDEPIGYFMDELSKILPEGQAAIFHEVGNEKLNYLAAYSIIATKNDGVRSIDMQSLAENMAQAMLSGSNYVLDNGYVISAKQAIKVAEQTELVDMKNVVKDLIADMDISDEEYELVIDNIDTIAKKCNENYVSTSLDNQMEIVYCVIKAELEELQKKPSKGKKDIEKE